MNICMVSRDFSYPPYGGIAAHVYELSKAIVGLGHVAHVVKVSYGSQPDSVEMIDGIAVHWIFVNSKLRGVRFAKLIAKTNVYINRLLKNESMDILHWHQLESSSLETKSATVKQIPKIFTNHSSSYLYLCETELGLIRLKFLLSHADAVISSSEELRQKTLLAWSNSDYNFCIPNGVDTSKFRPDVPPDNSLKEEYHIGDDDLIVLSPRRLAIKNGVKYLVESVSNIVDKVKDVKFLLVGDGPERENISKMIKDREISDYVIMTGGVTNDRMPSIYSLADIVVLPSLKESTSIAGLEAMASGKPLVGTNVGGIPAIIEDGKTGLLVSPRNSKDLGKAITRLLVDKELRLGMGAKARKKAEREFSWSMIAQKILDVYSSMIKTRGRRIK